MARSSPAATAATAHALPVTLAASSTRCSAGLRRSNCCSIISRTLAGTSTTAAAASGCTSHCPGTLPEHPTVEQMLDNRHHEERMPVRALVHDLREPPDRGPEVRPAGAPKRQILRDVRGREQLQGQFHRLAVQHQFLLDTLQGMPTHQRLDGPIGRQNEQPRGAQPAGQIRQQVQRGIVAPVQILQHQQQRAAGRQHLDRLGQLPQHALLGRPHDSALHRLERRLTE